MQAGAGFFSLLPSVGLVLKASLLRRTPKAGTSEERTLQMAPGEGENALGETLSPSLPRPKPRPSGGGSVRGKRTGQAHRYEIRLTHDNKRPPSLRTARAPPRENWPRAGWGVRRLAWVSRTLYLGAYPARSLFLPQVLAGVATSQAKSWGACAERARAFKSLHRPTNEKVPYVICILCNMYNM